MNDTLREIGTRLREYRKSKGLTQAQTAALLRDVTQFLRRYRKRKM